MAPVEKYLSELDKIVLQRTIITKIIKQSYKDEDILRNESLR